MLVQAKKKKKEKLDLYSYNNDKTQFSQFNYSLSSVLKI